MEKHEGKFLAVTLYSHSKFQNRSVKPRRKCSLTVIISFNAVLKFVFHSKKRLVLRTPINSFSMRINNDYK